MASLAKSGHEMLASAREAYIERLDSSDLAGAQKAMLLRVAGLKDIDSAKKQNDTDFSEQDGLLSTSNTKRMLRWLAEAVGRLLELSSGNETSKDVSALLDLLLTHMGELYVETALEAYDRSHSMIVRNIANYVSANDAAAAQENAKNEPDLSYLENLHSAIATMHLMVMCINTVLIPLAASHVTVRRDMEKTTTQILSRMEDKVNGIMQRTIDVVLAWVSRLLAGQKKSDFRPRDDSLNGGGAWLELLQTPVRNMVHHLSSMDSSLIPSTTDLSLDPCFSHPSPHPRRCRPLLILQSLLPPHRTSHRRPCTPPRTLQEVPRQRHRRHHGHQGYLAVQRATAQLGIRPCFRTKSGDPHGNWESLRHRAGGIEGKIARKGCRW